METFRPECNPVLRQYISVLSVLCKGMGLTKKKDFWRIKARSIPRLPEEANHSAKKWNGFSF
jgi:hypothetical protein